MNPTTWNFYTNNPATWDAMIAACESATTSIDFEIFIFTTDEIGTRFIEVCARKASQGVKVRFLWDAAGSFTLFKSSTVVDLRKKGIHLVFFKTLLPSFFSIHDYKSWYFRNHRRTLVVDGKIGFTGSTSIEKRMISWRDTSVRMEGPVVTAMQDEFNRMWTRAHNQRPAPLPPVKVDYEFEYLFNTPTPRRRFLYARVLEALRSAQKSICLTTPYFVPTHKLARIIRLAVLRGVEVKLLLPASSDYPIVDLGARTYFHQLLKAGVRIYLYNPTMIHTKTIIVDGLWSSIGTMNLDHISLMYNYEANLVSTNAKFAEELRGHFEEDLKQSREITMTDWNRRTLVEKIATFFVKFIRIFL